MKYVDTNILVRLIIDDNKELTDIAENAIRNNQCHLLPEVVPEIVCVLSKVYGFKRQAVAQAILQVLPLVVVKEVGLTRLALNYFGRLNLDYVDCLLLAKNKLYGHEIITLDKKLEKNLESLPPVPLY